MSKYHLRLIELAKKTLRLPATLGYPLSVLSITEKVNDLGFATVVGLLKWGSMMKFGSGGGNYEGGGRFGGGFKRVNQFGGQVKKWLKTLMP